MLKVNIKKLIPEATIPTYAKLGDAAMDLTATSKKKDGNGNIVYKTGLAMEIPDGHVGLIFPRSSVSKKYLGLANAVGVIDSGYRGEIICKFKPTLTFIPDDVIISEVINGYEVGERVAQIMIIPIPQIQFVEASELNTTVRGEGGFGSSGS